MNSNFPLNQLINTSKERIQKIDRQRRSIENLTGRLEPEIANMKLGEAKKYSLAVLHIDIHDFKQIVMNLNQSEYLRFVSVFLTEMTQIVDDLGGLIDRYVGDQVTALFGIDHQCENCASENSVKCALNMKTIIKYCVNPFLTSIGFPQIICSIGTDYGPIWIAKVGVRGMNQFTLIGTAVNTAAQLVEIASPGQILLAHGVYTGISQSDKNFCVEMTHPNWRWVNTSDNSRYKFYEFRSNWTGYPL